jgi:hypothetical protein
MIAENHGGTCNVESEVGRGIILTFYRTLLFNKETLLILSGIRTVITGSWKLLRRFEWVIDVI